MPHLSHLSFRLLLDQSARALLCVFALLLVIFSAALCSAASIRGMVTDASGAKVVGANVVLLSGGKPVGAAVSVVDGSYQITTGVQGRFYLVVSGKSFRQLETPSFYAGRMDSIERNIVLEPEWVRESIVVTATGTPTPQPQTSEATSVLGPLDLALRDDLVSSLRLMPGTVVVQTGQLGAQSSLFIRGGNSDANKILLDGIDAGDMGNSFDFGPLSTTAIERAEVYRGPDSSLYGAGAGSGVVSLTTPHGTTPYPSILFQGEGGNLSTSREELEVAGAYKKYDYLGAFSWLQTANDLPNDEFHVATTSANIGWQPTGSTQIRGTLHYGVDATGVPNAWDFFHVADDATQKDQDLFVSASIDNQTTASFHNSLRYGLTRKREQYNLWQPSGALIEYDPIDGYSAYYGNQVTITGANGASVTGQAQLDFPGSYPNGYQLVSNRDQLIYQGDYKVTPHLIAFIGFHFANERALDYDASFGTDSVVQRTNYDYLASVHGDFKNRFYYTLGGSLERYSLFGTQTSSHAGLSYTVLRPRKKIFSGTRILFNFGDGVREPKLTDQTGSLYTYLAKYQPQAIAQLHIGPLAAPATRTYEAGAEQALFGKKLIFRASYFHNQFGKEIEYVGGRLLPNLFSGLTPADLGYYYTDDYGLAVNTEAFRAQGVETTVESGLGKYIFFRGGYTYLDAVVQRSFDSDNEALTGGYAPTYPYGCTLGAPNCIAIGAVSPLVGARPFRRPPHTGFFTASYAQKNITAFFTSAFASRSDDSTYLEYEDISGNNSLLLPNRNLDWGYAKLDAGASFKLTSWLSVYGRMQNLTDNRHIAPIGYPSLPFNARLGLRIEWSKAIKH
jgi:iron complex outermembrane receptor protein/vitamin B12 transporter